MKKHSLLVLILVAAILVMSPAWMPQDKRDIQAVLVKVINNVQKNEPAKGWSKAVTADQLRSGYEVRTEPKSVAVIQFADLSKLVLREKSIAEIKGEVQGKQILDRQVHMARGGMKFEVTKGPKEQFRFTSPISVASIRGTSGLWSQNDSLTQYTMLSGSLNLLSLISNRSDDVLTNQTGRADSRGNLEVRQSTNDEKKDAQQTEDQQQKTKHQLKIEGQDQDGKKKTVIIEWEE